MVNYFGDLKLGDFGTCLTFEDDDSKCDEFIGTPGYMAPEVVELSWTEAKLNREGFTQQFKDGYTRAVDWWGVAVILYQMAMGYQIDRPFTLQKSSIHCSMYETTVMT